ncbi:hypothetical protein TNCV_1421011 [Trichonephila clavipes]|nr:hypothetical protein TNCV_1421011 [Trichonephila clavipes]
MPFEAYKDPMKTLIDANWRITTRKFTERLNLSNSTVPDHLKSLGVTSKIDIWVSYYSHVHVYNSVNRKRIGSKKDEPAQSISKANIYEKR